MKKVSEEYQVIVNVKGRGSFYVGLFNEGGGVNIFEISKSPLKTYGVLSEAMNCKSLFELSLVKDGYFDDYGDYFYTAYLEYLNVEEIKIMKNVVTTVVETSYI